MLLSTCIVLGQLALYAQNIIGPYEWDFTVDRNQPSQKLPHLFIDFKPTYKRIRNPDEIDKTDYDETR